MLAIVWHSRTGAARAMARAAHAGAFESGGDPRSVRLLAADDVCAEDLLAARGYLFVCPENLGGMSGAMKEMFDRCYYPLLGKLEGRPYATAIAAGNPYLGKATRAAGAADETVRALLNAPYTATVAE